MISPYNGEKEDGERRKKEGKGTRGRGRAPGKVEIIENREKQIGTSREVSSTVHPIAEDCEGAREGGD